MKKFFSFLVLLVVFFCFSVTAYASEPPRGFYNDDGKTHFNPLVFDDDSVKQRYLSSTYGNSFIAFIDNDFLYIYETSYKSAYREYQPTITKKFNDDLVTGKKTAVLTVSTNSRSSYCFAIQNGFFKYLDKINKPMVFDCSSVDRNATFISVGNSRAYDIPIDYSCVFDFAGGIVLGKSIVLPKVYNSTEFKITNDFNSELDKYKVKSMQLNHDVISESIAKREIIQQLYSDEKLKEIADFTVSEKDISFVSFVPPKNATKDDVTFKDGAFIADITLHVGTLTTQIKGVLGSITALEYKPAFDGKAPSAVIMANWLQALYSILVPCVIVGSALYCILTCVKIIPSSILKFTK